MQVFLGAVLFAIPNMTRQELLFAVPVPPDFRQSPAGRHALAMFRMTVTAAVLVGIALLLLSPIRIINVAVEAVTVGTVLCTLIAFYWQYRALTPFAVTIVGRRQAALTTAPDRLPWFAWLGACPFVIIGIAALYLYLNWDRIPARFPVHWSVNSPDRWADRTIKGVYGTLLFAAWLSAYGLIVALASWYGSRRSRSRPVMFGCIIAINSVVAGIFALNAVQPVLGISDWVINLGMIGAIVAIVIVVVNKMKELGEGPDPTPQECWKAGVIYFNPNDAVLFVERRGGLGYTLNFANRWSWVLLLGLVGVIALGGFTVG
jgi:uncharacterized membrane protein